MSGSPDADAGVLMPPDAGVLLPDDAGVLPDAGVLMPDDAGVRLPDATVLLPDADDVRLAGFSGVRSQDRGFRLPPGGIGVNSVRY